MADPPRFLVLHFAWLDQGTPRQETYGPWPAAGDDSHLTAISDFVKGWQKRTGILPAAVTLALCVDPAAWLAGDAASAAKPA
jgi:hypothetical protein